MPIWPFILALLLTVIGALVNNNHKNSEIADLKLTISQRETTSAQGEATAQTEVRSTEAGLADGAGQDRKKTNEQIDSLTSQRNALIRRLRIAEDRATRSMQLPKDSKPASDGHATGDGDGTQFPATIGTEDVEEASRADTIRVHLEACYSQYNRVKDALGKGGGSEVDQIANSSRSLPSIHFGGLPRPVQVAPVAGSRYLGATLIPVLDLT